MLGTGRLTPLDEAIWTFELLEFSNQRAKRITIEGKTQEFS